MNFRRSIIIWAVVLGSIAGLIYWDNVQTVIDEKEKEAKGKVFTETFENISSFNLVAKGDDGVVTDVSGALGESGWNLTAPTNAKGDTTQIESLVKAVLDYKYDRVISENQQDAAKYGLASPTARLTLKTKSGNELWLSVGEKTPVGYSAYVTSSSDSRVLLGSQHIVMSLKKTLKDLRDKTLIELKDTELSKLAVASRSSKSMQYEITRMNETLNVKFGPNQDKADSKKVASILNALKDNKVEDFDDAPSAKALQSIKNAKEGLNLDWTSSTGAKLNIQIAKTDGKVWALKSDSSTVFIVPEKLITDLTSTFFDLRDKTVLSFSANELKSVELGDKTYNRSEEGKWTEAASGEEPKFDLAGLVVDLSFLAPTDIAEFKQKNTKVKAIQTVKLNFAETHAAKSGVVTLYEEKSKDVSKVWVRYEPAQATDNSSGISGKLFEATSSLLNNLKEKTETPPAGEEKPLEGLEDLEK